MDRTPASDAAQGAGYIYVLQNQSFPDVVKIGYAKDVAKRVSTLNTAVPFPFQVRSTCRTRKTLADKVLHRIIEEQNPGLHVANEGGGTEFYRMSPEDAFILLKGWAAGNGLPPDWVEARRREPFRRAADDPHAFDPLPKCPREVLNLYLELRSRLLDADGVSAEDPGEDCRATFSRNRQKFMDAVLELDGLRLFVRDAAGGVSTRVLKDMKDLNRSMHLVWQSCLQAGSRAPENAPAAAPKPAPPEPAPAPRPAPKPAPPERPGPDPALAPKSAPSDAADTRRFAEDACASLEAFLAANRENLRGKTVMLFRADPSWPDLLKPFAEKFEGLGLKRLLAADALPGGAGKIFQLSKDISGNGHVGYGDLMVARTKDAGWNSADVLRFRGQADVVAAAPPPGHAAEFAAWAGEGGRQILVLGGRKSLEELASTGAGRAESRGAACWLSSIGEAPAPAEPADPVPGRRFSAAAWAGTAAKAAFGAPEDAAGNAEEEEEDEGLRPGM